MRSATRVGGLALLATLVAAFVATACSRTLVLAPIAPATVTPPSTSVTLLAPASWSVPVAAGATCPTAGAPTFGQTKWDTFLTNLATLFKLASPTHATLSRLHIEFPRGCYYLNSPVYFDTSHPLVDVLIDGRYTGNPANAPQFVQTNVPACATGASMLIVQSPATRRVRLTGLTLRGSAPAAPPYCGSSPGGFAVTGAQGTTGPHDVALVGNYVHNTWGDNVYVGIVDRLLADSNVLRVAGRQSMSVTAGHDITVTHNTLEFADGLAFSIETNQGSDNVSRVLVASNSGSYSDAVGTDAGKFNGALWNATAAVGTTVSDVMFRNNTSKSALNIWSRVGVSSSGVGAIHRLAFVSNTTTGKAGMIFAFAGDNVTITGNKVLSGPAVSLNNWTDNPVTMYIGVPTMTPSAVCGTVSGNTFIDSTGSTRPLRTASHNGKTVSYGYTMPAC